ncbi:hypothetical protein Glove_585g41 [Diversispora epigaea]|uniref:Uncharacterized protein n=1 Tax=Diversispora epigaea TaxID=1348612 RepID=A0A397GB63_9GLOM|nr:hypothetical protein Glove_585g41 [Diversispora epigaea]
MMTKSKIFTFLAALLLICLVFSQASPLPRAVGDKAVVSLPKVDGKITFTQIDATHVKAEGQLHKGIEENKPDDYFVQLASLPKKSFTELGIKIKVPGTDPWSASDSGLVGQLIGLDLKILHKSEILDSEKITKA